MKQGAIYVGIPFEAGEIAVIKAEAKGQGRSRGQQARIFAVDRMKTLGLLPAGHTEITRKHRASKKGAAR